MWWIPFYCFKQHLLGMNHNIVKRTLRFSFCAVTPHWAWSHEVHHHGHQHPPDHDHHEVVWTGCRITIIYSQHSDDLNDSSHRWPRLVPADRPGSTRCLCRWSGRTSAGRAASSWPSRGWRCTRTGRILRLPFWCFGCVCLLEAVNRWGRATLWRNNPITKTSVAGPFTNTCFKTQYGLFQ